MGVWDKTTPAGSASVSEGDDRIREMKVAIEEALEYAGIFPGSTPLTAPKYIPIYFPEFINVDPGTERTCMAFYNTAAPTGWTRKVDVNDVFIRVVSAGSPGTTGGTYAASKDLVDMAVAHVHTGPSHTHDICKYDFDIIMTGLTFYKGTFEGSNYVRVGRTTNDSAVGGTDAGAVEGMCAVTGVSDGDILQSDTAGTGGTGSSGGNSLSGSYAYADFLIATKDAYA